MEKRDQKQRVICLDSGVLSHKAIFVWGASKKQKLLQGDDSDPVMASYTYLNMCYGILKKIGINKDDIVIIACDARNSWRKFFSGNYKGNRQGLRDSNDHINWALQYSLINKLEDQLNKTTNWHFLKFDNTINGADLYLSEENKKIGIKEENIDVGLDYGIEADDIMSCLVRHFKDKEVILVTIDEDLSQLYYFDNCKIFNPNLKSPTNKAKKGFYKIVKDPLKLKSKKIRLGDVSDNIKVDKKDSLFDVEVRKLIIDLLKLPSFVEEPIFEVLKNLPIKKVDYINLPFSNSLGKRFDTIYESNNTVTWEESVKMHELKEEKRLEKQRKNYRRKKKVVKV